MRARPERRVRRGGRLIRWLRSAVKALRCLVGVVAWAPALIVATPSRPYLPDVLSHFAPHAILVLCALSLALLLARWKRDAWNAGIAALAALVAAGLVAGWGIGSPSSKTADEWRRVRIVTYNARGEASRNDEEMINWLLAQDADVICILDQPYLFTRRADRLRAEFPHVVAPERGLAWRIILMSRTPVERTPSVDGREHQFSFMAHRTVEIESRSGALFQMSAMHPPSPRERSSWERAVQLAQRNGEVARALQRRGLPLVVAGDFNSTPIGRVHRTFARESGLRTWEHLLGYGTWPAWAAPTLSLPIDRVWVSAGVRIERVRVGPELSSDHRPVVADVLIRDASSGTPE